MKAKAVAIALMAAIVLGVWSSALNNGFVYDDHKYLLGNPWIKDAVFTADIFLSSASGFQPGDATSNTYRPMLYMLYMAEYLSFGLTPFYFHLVNILCHALNAALVFLLSSNLLEKEGGGQRVYPALFAGLAFGLHTINSEAVNWVSASTELFFALFVLAGLNLYLRRASGLLSAPFFLAALLFKETAAALPLIVFLYDFSTGRGIRERWKAYALFAAAGGLYWLMRFHAIGALMHHKQSDLSFFEAVLNVFPLVAAYLGKLVLPVGLSAIYEFRPAVSLFDARVIAGAAVVVCFLAAMFFSRKRPAIFTGLAMMSAPLLPVLYVPALSSSAMADRYLYLPSAGLAIVMASLVSRLDGKAAMASAAFASALLGAWAAGSVDRSHAWRSDKALWADAVIKAPGAPNAQYNYAWANHSAGDLVAAVEHYRRAAALAPSADAHYNIGVIFMGQSLIEEADAEFRAALMIDPAFNEARAMLMEIQRIREAGA